MSGTKVRIRGKRFTGATSAAIGGVNITGFQVIDDENIEGSTGAHVDGLVDVTVVNAGGSHTLRNAYEYVGGGAPAPTVSSVSPSIGDPAGGGPTTRVITGVNLTGATAVRFGGVAVGGGGFSVINDTTINVTSVPAHAANVVDVEVDTPGGTGTGTNAYEYWDPTVISPTQFYKKPNYNGGTSTWTATVGANATGQGGPPYAAAAAGAPDFEYTTDFPLGHANTTWVGTGDQWMFCRCKIESIQTAGAFAFNNHSPISDTSQWAGIHLRRVGAGPFTFEAIGYAWQGATKNAIEDITALVDAVGASAAGISLQMKKSGGRVWVKVNDNAWTQGDLIGATDGTAALRLGTIPIDGITYTVGAKASPPSDADASKFARWSAAEFP